MIEAIELSEEVVGEELSWNYQDSNRIGDHNWWIGDNGRFQSHYPNWTMFEASSRRFVTSIANAGVLPPAEAESGHGGIEDLPDYSACLEARALSGREPCVSPSTSP